MPEVDQPNPAAEAVGDATRESYSHAPRSPRHPPVSNEVLCFLLGLAALLGVARALGELLRRCGFPSVVGEILAGIVLGKTILGHWAPGAFAWLFPDGPSRQMLNGYTTVAVMLLLVVAGIEIDLTVVRRSGRVVGRIAALDLVLPDHFLANPARREVHSAFLGIALSISALPVIAADRPRGTRCVPNSSPSLKARDCRWRGGCDTGRAPERSAVLRRCRQ